MIWDFVKFFARNGAISISAGTRTILLTVLISGAAAVLFPVEEETDGQ